MDVKTDVQTEDSELNREQVGAKTLRNAVLFVRTLQELSHHMEAIEEHKTQDDQSEASVTNGKECMCDIPY